MFKSSKACKLASLIILASLSTAANAARYLVDFSQFVSPSGNWNSLTTLQNSNVALIDDTGSSSSVALSHNLLGDSNITGGWTIGDTGWVVTDAVTDGFYSGSSASITFTGLNNGAYALGLVSAEDGDSSPGAFTSTSDIKVMGDFADSNRLGTSANGDDWNTKTDGVNNWLQWESVSVTGGNLTITIDAPVSGFTTINAIELVSVPEPSSSMLVGLAFIGLTLRRSRK